MSLLAKLFAESDGSPYLFLPLERLAAIAGELANGPLGPNYELVNNMNRHFDYVQRQAREALAREREAATEKVPWERGTIHDLRRTYGTRMSRIVPIHVLKEYMGHAKIQTTQEYYLAAEAEDADKARSGMEALLSKPAPQARTLRAPEGSEAKPEQSKNDESPGNAETSVNEADGTRTRNHRIDSRRGECPNPRQNGDLRDISPAPAAPGAAPTAESPLPPDLAAVVAAWPALPPAVRAGIAAMVQASTTARGAAM
ncbi:MAG: hypothetical protein AMXMBFR58_31690 [Phycisphaerae bacterium]